MVDDSYSPEVAARAKELTKPSRLDIVRAKAAILQLLSDGRARWSAELICCLLDPEQRRLAEQDILVEVPAQRDPSTLNADMPALAGLRLRSAATEALAELEAQGMAIPAEASDGYSPNTIVGGATGVRVQHSAGSGGVAWVTDLPSLRPAYRLPHWMLGTAELPTYLDRDLFLTDVTALNLDDRTTRCLREALEAFRRGLYVASASLLGAVSEGAWYAAGERLRDRDPRLAKALDEERTSSVQQLVTEQLASTLGKRSPLPGELHAHAALLRESSRRRRRGLGAIRR